MRGFYWQCQTAIGKTVTQWQSESQSESRQTQLEVTVRRAGRVFNAQCSKNGEKTCFAGSRPRRACCLMTKPWIDPADCMKICGFSLNSR